MRPNFTGLIDSTVIETVLEDEGVASSLPDVSAMAGPGKESKPPQFPPKTAKPVLLPGQLSPRSPFAAICRQPLRRACAGDPGLHPGVA